jgi:putative transposase
MNLTPFATLTWAYQLHYYLCFRTHRRRTLFSSEPCADLLSELIQEISANHDYHLLERNSYPTQLRCLLSLQPSQTVAKAVQVLKANSSRELRRSFHLSVPVWATGYLARSSGAVRISTVREYLDEQPIHHGYESRVLPPVYSYRAPQPQVLRAQHAAFELSHHLVFSTQYRKGVFGANIGQALSEYWLGVAAKRDFALDQISVVPDHIHLIVRIVPKMSIEQVALLLMNNGQYFIGKRYPELLIQRGMTQLWNASAYAGTCGEITTGLIMKWLQSDE